MLLSNIIELLRTDLEALNWMQGGKYGGLTQRAIQKVLDANNKAKEKSFPILCNYNLANCNNPTQFYTELVPDDTKPAILYWEPLNGLTDQGSINNNSGGFFGTRRYTGIARLVGWVNTKKLGVSDCNLSGKLIRSLMPILTKDIKNLTGELDKGRLKVRLRNEVVKSEAIFSAYSYDLGRQYLMNPFDYFALDVSFELTLPATCAYEVALGAPIDC